MEIWIKIELDNAAFQDGYQEHEVSRILTKALPMMPEQAGAEIPLRDINGNSVGFAGVYEKPQILIQRVHTNENDINYNQRHLR